MNMSLHSYTILQRNNGLKRYRSLEPILSGFYFIFQSRLMNKMNDCLIIKLVQTQLRYNLSTFGINCLSHEPKGINKTNQGRDTHVLGEDNAVRFVVHNLCTCILSIFCFHLANLFLVITFAFNVVDTTFVRGTLLHECHVFVSLFAL